MDERSAGAGGWVEAGPVPPREILARLAGFPRLVARHRDLLWTWLRRDLAARLSGTALGRLWPFLQPLVLFAVYWFVFARLLGFRLPDLPEELSAALGVWMFVGVLVWSGFADGLARAATSLVEHRGLLQRLAFPAEVLPLNAVLLAVVTQLFGLGVFLLASLFTPVWPAPGAALAWIPLLLLLQVLFTVGLGLLASALHVFVRDVQPTLVALLTVGMFVTPVFWVPAPEVLPAVAEWRGWIAANPLNDLLYTWRHVLLSARPELAFDTPFGLALARLAAWSLASFVLGHAFFSASRRRFADEV